MERPKMKRREPRKRLGWRGPLGALGVIIIGLTTTVVAVAIYTCDLDEVQGVRGLSDGLRTLIDMEKQDKGGGSPPGVPYRQVMKVQGAWNGMTLEGVDPGAPALGPAAGVPAAGRRPRGGVMVAWIDPEKGERARRAGIQPGDTIVGVDQRKVGGLADMGAASQKVEPGEPLMVHLVRQGQLLTMVLPPEAPPQIAPAALTGPNAYCPHDGVLVPPAQAAGGVCPICGGPLYLYSPNPQVPR